MPSISLASYFLLPVSLYFQVAFGAVNLASVEPRAAGDICALVGQGAGIVGGRLFFAQGSYSFDSGDTLVREPKFFSIDLTTEFDATTYITTSEYTSTQLPSGLAYDDDSGVFFHDNASIYLYDPIEANDQAWIYRGSNNSFANTSVAGYSNLVSVGYTGAWTSNPATGQSYFTGAPSSALAKRSPTSPWLQVLNTTTSSPQWLAGAGGGPLLSAAQMVYVRAGKAGILVAFGGVDPNDHTQFASSTLGAYRSMDQIFVFDIASSTWFNVTATGANGDSDIPSARISFCAVVSSAPDDTSFQITVYGGYNLHNTGATGTVHVLTLPTFQWIDVTPAGGEYAQGVGRQSHQCVVWNDAQMISLGGTIQGNTSAIGNIIENGCNSSHPPVLVLDTTKFEWQDSFLPNRTYSQPPAVYKVIGGDYRGNNINKAPAKGFNDTRLSAIFTQTVARVTQPTSFPSTSTASSTSTSSSNPNALPASNIGPTTNNRTAILAGSVIGGIVFLALVGSLSYFFMRRYKKRNNNSDYLARMGKAELPAQLPVELPNPEGFYAPRRVEVRHEMPAPEMVYEVEGEGRAAEGIRRTEIFR